MAKRDELHPGVSVTYQDALYTVVAIDDDAVKLCHVNDHGHTVFVHQKRFGEICLLDSPEGVEACQEAAIICNNDLAPALKSLASTPPASA
jgi:hypothetical protein